MKLASNSSCEQNQKVEESSFFSPSTQRVGIGKRCLHSRSYSNKNRDSRFERHERMEQLDQMTGSKRQKAGNRKRLVTASRSVSQLTFQTPDLKACLFVFWAGNCFQTSKKQNFILMREHYGVKSVFSCLPV